MAHDAGWLAGSALPQGWQAQPAWSVLDTDFGSGQKFFDALATWVEAAPSGRLLHYVALTAAPAPLGAVLAEIGRHPRLQAIRAELRAQWFGLTGDFHRLALHNQRVLLTLCVGPARAQLQAQRCLFDSIWLDAADGTAWDTWDVKALARCCRRGTDLATQRSDATLRHGLEQCGFALDAPGDQSGLRGSYQPGWDNKRSRRPMPPALQRTRACIVVGAGLAGASAAAALARRGWPVTVLDAAAQPAAGASGLPVGLCAPHVSADDSPRSRLSRCGLRQTLIQARALLRAGEDWAPSGLLELRLGRASGLPAGASDAAQAWSRHADGILNGAVWGAGMDRSATTLWHPHAAWIKPSRLVAAWLKQPGVRFQGNAPVDSVRRDGGRWLVLDPSGRELGRAGLLVLAVAGDTARLLQGVGADRGVDVGASTAVPPMQALAGQVSWGWHTEAQAASLPPFPVNGAGSFIAHVPMQGGHTWHAGSTYETTAAALSSVEQGHADNLQRLRTLLPPAADFMEVERQGARVHSWSGVRQVCADRLPLLGALGGRDGATLWLCTAMGSRGLTLAALCAELLAAQVCAEPLPVPWKLLNLLRAGRARPGH